MALVLKGGSHHPNHEPMLHRGLGPNSASHLGWMLPTEVLGRDWFLETVLQIKGT